MLSSTGRALSNLEDVINSALSETRILNNQSAKALCRNGLLVLIVDGFDELLGNSGYDNPLGSLESWFRDLRGRGVLIASARSNYYMTRYRKALNETTDLNVDHVVVNILPWQREDIKKFLKQNGTDDSVFEQLTDRDWSLLSIPFFSKAFAAWRVKHSPTYGDSIKIFEVVVDLYLERESNKILDQSGKPLLGAQDLQALFSEIAEMMFQNGKRDIEQTELEFCAQVALDVNDLDGERPGLRRRLTSLCGLSAGEMMSGGGKFLFSHEIMFDCFLSLSLQRRCSAGINNDYLLQFFGQDEVRPAVIEWFVVSNPEVAVFVLNKLSTFESKLSIPSG